jgi:hypothetical protein
MFSMLHADELYSPNVCQSDSDGGIWIILWAAKREKAEKKSVLPGDQSSRFALVG